MTFRDDTLIRFAEVGPPDLPPGSDGFVERDGARIWYTDIGTGLPVVLLHGGMGNAGNWGHQVPALAAAGYRVLAVDSRGHGRSSWDGRPFSYEQMADDILAILDDAGLARAAIVGWSDGACTGLAMARKASHRIAGVLYFGCNVDAAGTLPFTFTPTIGNCLERHKKDHAALSPAPDDFERFSAALSRMQQNQPNYSAEDLAAIAVPMTVVQAEHDEFIRREHARYIAATIPGADFVPLAGVGHFAPVQWPEKFNFVVLTFLETVSMSRWSDETN